MGCVIVAFDEGPWVKIFDISNTETKLVSTFKQISYFEK